MLRGPAGAKRRSRTGGVRGRASVEWWCCAEAALTHVTVRGFSRGLRPATPKAKRQSCPPTPTPTPTPTRRGGLARRFSGSDVAYVGQRRPRARAGGEVPAEPAVSVLLEGVDGCLGLPRAPSPPWLGYRVLLAPSHRACHRVVDVRTKSRHLVDSAYLAPWRGARSGVLATLVEGARSGGHGQAEAEAALASSGGAARAGRREAEVTDRRSPRPR